MKVKNYVMGDFGGVSYKQGDFHTVGQSGLGASTELNTIYLNKKGQLGSMGFSLNDVFTTVFGTQAEAVKSQLQSGAASIATNVVGTKLATNAEAKQGVVDTVKASVAQIYQDNKAVVWIVGGGLALLAGLGLYNTFKKR